MMTRRERERETTTTKLKVTFYLGTNNENEKKNSFLSVTNIVLFSGLLDTYDLWIDSDLNFIYHVIRKTLFLLL